MEGKCFDCLGSYLSLCSRFGFEAPWDWLAADPAAYRGPSSPADALAHLAEDHAAEDLIASGIAQRGDNNVLSIHPSLAEPDVVVLALRQCDSKGVTNLVTNNGCVHGANLPLFESLHDVATYKAPAINGEKNLLLTGSLEDAVVFRQLGFAATPVVGLDTLRKQGVERLCTHFGLTQSPTTLERLAARSTGSPLAKSTMAQQQVTLSLASWSPTKLSLVTPEPIAHGLEHLDNLSRFCGLDIGNILEWTPTEQELARIKYVVGQQDPDWIRDAVIESWDQSQYWLERSDAAQASQPTPDLSDVFQRLHKTDPMNSGDRALNQQKQAILEYDQVVAREFIGNLLRDAQKHGRPRYTHVEASACTARRSISRTVLRHATL